MTLKRRDFLKNGISIAALGLVAPSFLVKSAYALSETGNGGRGGRGELPVHGASGAAAGSLKKNVLVVVQLSGGNDGVGTVIPYADPAYYAARPTLAQNKDDVLRLTESMGLHPGMKGFKGLYDNGHMAVIQGVGYPNPNRSHFRSMAIWQSARPDVNEPTGWLGRYLEAEDDDAKNTLRAINIGNLMPRTLWTETTLVPSLTNLNTIIYIVRHTDVHNPDDLLYGRLPRFGLSALGRIQAENTAQVLADTHVDAFYSSPMLRARQTISIIGAKHPGVPIHISSLLNEVKTGWQGKPHSALEAIRFDFYNQPVYVHDEGLDALWARISRFVQRARRLHNGQSVLAVTHGDIVALARAGYRGLPIHITSIRLPHPYPGKGGILKLTFSDPKQALPSQIEYYDPNGEDPQWSSGWTVLEPSQPPS